MVNVIYSIAPYLVIFFMGVVLGMTVFSIVDTKIK